MLLSGLVLTIETAICAWIIALVTGSIIGVLRTLPSKTAFWVSFRYVEFFRNMPLLVQLFLWFFVLPELLPRSAGLWMKQMSNAPFYTAAMEDVVKHAIVARGDRGRALHVRARGRATGGGRRIAAARAKDGRHRAWANDRSDLSLRAAADGVSNRAAAADIRISLDHQEHVGRDHHRPDRTDRPGPCDAGVFLSGIRSLHRCDRVVPPDQCRGRHRHALRRARGGGPRLYIGQVSSTHVRQFRFRRHLPLLRLPVHRRHDVHLDADR